MHTHRTHRAPHSVSFRAWRHRRRPICCTACGYPYHRRPRLLCRQCQEDS